MSDASSSGLCSGAAYLTFDPCPLHLSVLPTHLILRPQPLCLLPSTDVPQGTSRVCPAVVQCGQALGLLGQGFSSVSQDSWASDRRQGPGTAHTATAGRFFILLLQNCVPGRSRGCQHPPARLPGWEVGSLSLTWLFSRLAPLASWAWLSARLLNRRGGVSREWGHHSPRQGTRVQALTGFKGLEPHRDRPCAKHGPLCGEGASPCWQERKPTWVRGEGPADREGGQERNSGPAGMAPEERVWAWEWGKSFQVAGHAARRVGCSVTRVQGTRQGSISCAHLLI